MSLRHRFLSLLALASFAVIGIARCLAGSVTLTWPAPGDDSLAGRATRFDLRYSIQPLTAANFSLATAASNLPIPGLPGFIESTRIDALTSGQTYYFAIKTADDANNWSVMSGVVSRVPQDVAGVGVSLALRFSAPCPNPAREQSQFCFELPSPMHVLVEVIDITGRRIRTLLNDARGAGINNLTFDLRDEHGSRLAQGVYLVRARLGEAVIMRRLVVTR
jgi:hypothetical protein